MKMKHAIATLIVALLLVVSLSSCDIIIRLFGSVPDPNLTGPSFLQNGEAGTFDSGISADEVEENDLTLSWYVNDVLQTSLDPDTIQVKLVLRPDNSQDYTLRVVVSDGDDETEDSMGVTIGAPNFRIQNNSGVSVWYVYMKSITSSTWSTDILGNSTISTGYYMNFYINPGTYNFLASDQSGDITWGPSADITTSTGIMTWILGTVQANILPEKINPAELLLAL